VGDPVPNIEPADHRHGTRGWAQPAGLGPVASFWSPRAERAGTYDEKWEESRQPLLPVDFDDRHHQCAPDDQQALAWLRGGEPVLLQGLTPEGRTTLSLPRVALGFDTLMDGKHHLHGANLHTVIIETAERRVILVWQTSLRCHGFLQSLRGTTIYEKEVM
jgi:hypothetical protein